eukprot:jgi/Astpho2/6645/fgenesh1_pm.00101_%23_16_t
MAELHVVGEIVGASGFSSKDIFCKWGLAFGRAWEHLEGETSGQTQTATGRSPVWAHPVDAHFLCKGLSGWPKLHFQVWRQSSRGRADICGYGFCHVPTASGVYDLECTTWAPDGTFAERVTAFLRGGAPQLRVEEVAYQPGDRFRLQTTAAGTVHLHLGVITKDFAQANVQTGC